MRRLDELRRVRIVAQGLPDFANRDLEDGIADEHAAPGRIEQFLLRRPAFPAGWRGTAEPRTLLGVSGTGVVSRKS